MAKTLDQLPVAVAPQPNDIFLIQQNNLDRQVSFANGSTSLQATLWANLQPLVVGTEASIATTARTVPWSHLTGIPTTTDWSTIINRPSTLTNYGITDAIHNNADGVLTGSLIITGVLTVGTINTQQVIQTNTQQINITDNVINLNSNLTGTPPANLQGGIQVNRGSALAYQFFWDELTQTFRIGQAGRLEAVATREDNPVNLTIPFWNSTYNEYNSSAVTVVGNTMTGNLTGVALTASNITTANNVTATTYYPVFVSGAGASLSPQVSTGGLSYVPSTGTLSASRVLNAFWNDIADFVEVADSLEIVFGKAYARNIDGVVVMTENYMQKGILGIASDTFGFGVGQKPSGVSQLPIAIGGFVLAYVDKVYEPGTALTSSRSGFLTEYFLADKRDYPERMVAVFDRVETGKTWNGILVSGRHWVKVI